VLAHRALPFFERGQAIAHLARTISRCLRPEARRSIGSTLRSRVARARRAAAANLRLPEVYSGSSNSSPSFLAEAGNPVLCGFPDYWVARLAGDDTVNDSNITKSRLGCPGVDLTGPLMDSVRAFAPTTAAREGS
jgi:hypothetical protein